ncbi:hypothetical protein KG487_002066 [Salmonella enterica subsp. enterica serovar 4,5,12:b:-]|nr:hypothetical protein [Salmonella enterica subsp. enterica]ECJ0732535.1 hypothetical protein [Salmonella enterica]EGR9571031.1 hypothetical protein [Salmonella enterica subsp. enterica serovar Grumpensis]EHF1447854.1 hypothetical protein [Salmonella enterica subsp. enterica serovar 4,5,12:b:-]EHG1527438.1 hypothetical protein [Salmonella enterica subsp. enterica serovar 4,[5],12:b:-]
MISKEVWAPPLVFGSIVDLEAHAGPEITYTVYFETDSTAPSTFTAMIIYYHQGKEIVVNVNGPGSYLIRSDGAGVDKISFKSHSFGQMIHVYTNLK